MNPAQPPEGTDRMTVIEHCRDEAVRNIDAQWGCTVEFSWDPARHRDEYDREEERLIRERLRGAVEAVRAHRDRWYEANSKSPDEARPSDRELWRVVFGSDVPGGQ